MMQETDTCRGDGETSEETQTIGVDTVLRWLALLRVIAGSHNSANCRAGLQNLQPGLEPEISTVTI